MGLKKYIQQYKSYEGKELARRAAKKKKLQVYRSLKTKNIITKKPKRKFSTAAYTKAIGNPYGTKFPKAKKVLKKAKKSKRRKLKRKVVIVYK